MIDDGKNIVMRYSFFMHMGTQEKIVREAAIPARLHAAHAPKPM